MSRQKTLATSPSAPAAQFCRFQPISSGCGRISRLTDVPVLCFRNVLLFGSGGYHGALRDLRRCSEANDQSVRRKQIPALPYLTGTTGKDGRMFRAAQPSGLPTRVVEGSLGFGSVGTRLSRSGTMKQRQTLSKRVALKDDG